MNHLDPLNELFAGTRRPPLQPQVRTAMQGTILDVSEDSATFYLDDFGKEHRFGPAPFSVAGTVPEPGNTCLVIFSGQGVDRPWIVGWQSAS